jgi:hypothetical protein
MELKEIGIFWSFPAMPNGPDECIGSSTYLRFMRMIYAVKESAIVLHLKPPTIFLLQINDYVGHPNSTAAVEVNVSISIHNIWAHTTIHRSTMLRFVQTHL